MKKIVTDKEFNDALVDSNNIRIGKSVLRKFQFDDDTARECWLMGLWKALQNYKNDKNATFLTYLHNRIYWHCCLVLKQRSQNKNKKIQSLCQDVASKEEISVVEILEEIPEQHREIVYDYFINGMKLKELAKKYKFSLETARKHIKKALNSVTKKK